MRMQIHVVMAAFLLLSGALSGCGEPAKDPSSKPGRPGASAAVAQAYEGKIVRQPPGNRGKDDGWYLVKNGQRRWITDASWLEKNGYQAAGVIEIDSATFAAIPEDPNPLQ
jgi:hypothetical protein